MLAKTLLEQLLILQENNHDFEELTVHVAVNEPSIGPISTESVKSVQNGLDWNKGKLILNLENPVIRDVAGTRQKKVKETATHIYSIGEGIIEDELVNEVLTELETYVGSYNAGTSMNGMTIIAKSK